MKETKSKIMSRIEFSSLADIAMYVKNTNVNKSFAERSRLASETSDRDFTGTDNMDEANQLMIGGYREGLENLINVKGGCKFNVGKSTKTVEFRQYGFCPCVGRAISGNPRNMFFQKKQIAKTPVINIFYDITTPYFVSKDDMLRAGKNLLATIQYLESQNMRVELTLIDLINDTPEKDKYKGIDALRSVACSVLVKKASQSMNPLLLAYPITHASFYRRHIFAVIERANVTDKKKFVDGYGICVIRDPKEMTKHFQNAGIIKSENDKYVNCTMLKDCNTINECINALGIKIVG